MLASPHGDTPVLVLAPHAQTGRRISMVISLLFIFGFHAALVYASIMNWDLPCERPLPAFLLSAGVIGIASGVLYTFLEMRRISDEQQLPPPAAPPPASQVHKVLVLLLLLCALCAGVVGTAMYTSAPTCAFTSPVVHTWSLAALVLYASFAALVVGVPLLSVAFPLLALALVPIIATLVSLAAWLSDAGKRGAHGAASVLHRWLRLGSDDAAPPQPQPTIANPASTFALYVNTAALVWLFGFMIVEVYQSWSLPCDAPLATYVLGVSTLGLLLSLLDFILEIFRDPMPPITKLEHTKAKEDRSRRLVMFGWVVAAVVVWGALGCAWLGSSTTCAKTAPAIYRLALLLSLLYSAGVALVALAIFGLGVDFCLSGKLRMIVVLEQ